MARKITDEKYLQEYVQFLNDLLNQFVTDSRLSLLAGPDKDHRLVSRLQAQQRLPLELRPNGSLLFMQLIRREARADGDHVVVEQAVYQYSPTLEHDNDWLFRYEYRRTPQQNRPHSHFHLNAVHPTNLHVRFDRLHFPAGRLSIEQLLAHLILEHNIEAKVYDPIPQLAETHKHFTSRRTDLDDPPFP